MGWRFAVVDLVHVDVEKAQGWSDKQVLGLWHTLYKGTLLTQKIMRDDTLSQSELISLNDSIRIYRQRNYLTSVSKYV